MQKLLEQIRRESRVAVWWAGPTACSILFRRKVKEFVVCTATVAEWKRATELLEGGSVIDPRLGLGCRYRMQWGGEEISVFMKCPDLTILPFYKFIPEYGLTATPRSARWWLRHEPKE